MKFVLEITELDNAAFNGGDFHAPREYELSRILHEVANKILDVGLNGVCRDICGNKVGTYGLTEDKDE